MTDAEKSARNREYYLKNRERILKYQHQYYEENKAAEAKRKAEYYRKKKAKAELAEKLLAENVALKQKLFEAEAAAAPTA